MLSGELSAAFNLLQLGNKNFNIIIIVSNEDRTHNHFHVLTLALRYNIALFFIKYDIYIQVNSILGRPTLLESQIRHYML